MRRFIFLSALLFLTACQSTRTNGVSFIDPDFRGGRFNSLVVEGQAGLSERQALEFAAADALYARGIEAIPATQLISPAASSSEAQRKKKAVGTGAEGILVIRLIGKDVVSSRSYAGGPYYGGGLEVGRGRHGTFGGLGVGFPLGSGTIGSPYTDYRELRAQEGLYEAILYSLPDFRSVWRGEFKTRGPYTMDYGRISQNVAEQVVERLRMDGVI